MPHPDAHTHGLADGCPRCYEHALDPFAGLDQTMLADLIRRVEGEEGSRSQTEGFAMARVRDILDCTARMFQADPDAVRRFLADRWQVEV